MADAGAVVKKVCEVNPFGGRGYPIGGDIELGYGTGGVPEGGRCPIDDDVLLDE